MDLYTYIQYFILGGLITVFVNYALEKYKHGPALTAYLYCAPTIYLLIIYIIYKDRGLKGYYTFIVHSLINYVANSVVILFLILLTKYTSISLYMNCLLVSILFIYYSIYYFMHTYKIEFTP
jgi:hypothetical protein